MNSHLLRHLSLSGQILVSICALFCATALAAPNPQISLDGGNAELRENIRQYLTIAEENCSAPLWRLKALLVDGSEEIEKAAQALGYYQLKFTTKLTQEHECWQLRIHLDPGERVHIAEVNLSIKGEGEQDDVFKPLFSEPGIRVGDALNHGRYEEIKSRIATMAAGHGYFDGRFEQTQILVNTSDNSAVIVLEYNTGARYRIGDVRIQHDILSENFLRRYLNIRRGDFYDTDKLLELKNLYNATSYFNLATAAPDLQHLEDQQVPIDVELEKRKRREYTLGYGISTDTGPRVLLGYEDRYLTDSGHKLKADLSTSNIKTNAQLAYTIPLEQPSYEFLKFIPAYENENTDTTYSLKKSFATTYTYYQQNHWLHTYSISDEWEQSRISDEPLINTHLLIPAFALSRTQTDASPYPLSGWAMQVKISTSPTTLGSDVSFVQENFLAKYIQPLAIGRLLLRTEIGMTQVGDVKDLPISVRYFAGGDASVRGYDYKSLGPKNDKAVVVGGSSLWVNSIEYDYLFRRNWAVAAFYDAGNAGDNFNFELKRGAGLGIRWISPVGPVRIDIAKALDEKQGWHLHVSMGPDL